VLEILLVFTPNKDKAYVSRYASSFEIRLGDHEARSSLRDLRWICIGKKRGITIHDNVEERDRNYIGCDIQQVWKLCKERLYKMALILNDLPVRPKELPPLIRLLSEPILDCTHVLIPTNALDPYAVVAGRGGPCADRPIISDLKALSCFSLCREPNFIYAT
jgi:hypothetical protein